ncbi:MAG: ribosome silencing factor [Lentisphaeria bacterium]|nr:ribosome silencing factor [Lentisphaeria bacterium]MBR7127167.1 ribosome silencing factor [Lentisphaeria bacterium]
MSEAQKIDSEKLAAFCVAEAENKLAENIVSIKVSAQTTIADYFILCTANNDPHINAIVNNIERQVRDEFKLRPLSVDGDAASGWILIDFGMVIVHVMTEECRARYRLESLWSELPSLDDLENAAIKANLKN